MLRDDSTENQMRAIANMDYRYLFWGILLYLQDEKRICERQSLRGSFCDFSL